MRPDAVDHALQQWRRERPDLDPSPIAVFGRVARVYALAEAELRRLLSAYELTPATFDVLANLRRSGTVERRTAGDLAASSLTSTGGTSFRLDRLEAQGLIARSNGERDKRVVFVDLTEAGREVIDEVMTAHLAQRQEMLDALEPEQTELLARLLGTLERSVLNYKD